MLEIVFDSGVGMLLMLMFRLSTALLVLIFGTGDSYVELLILFVMKVTLTPTCDCFYFVWTSSLMFLSGLEVCHSPNSCWEAKLPPLRQHTPWDSELEG